MKKLFFFLALLFALSCPLTVYSQESGMPVKLNKTLPKPPHAEVLKNPGSESGKLKKLLDEGKLREFYLSAKSLFKTMNPLKDEDLTLDTLSDRLWVYYYYSAAPDLPVESDEDMMWRSMRNDLDLRVKNIIGRTIKRHSPELLSKRLSFQKKELAELLASYYAGIMKSLYDNYDPWWRDKLKTLREENSAKKQSIDEKYMMENRINSRDGRNKAAGMSLRFHEEGFVKFLMECFPKNAAMIKKYISKAGYRDDEFVELIELTAGRNPGTAFLLKGSRNKGKDNPDQGKRQDVPRHIAL